MSESADIPEPDRLEGAPHPRETLALVGQQHAEAAFLDAYTSGRLHHAWLITGPRGVGKATLAWRLARFLLTAPEPGGEDSLFGAPSPPDTLDIDPEHPVNRRVQALSEPRLFLLRRPWDDKAKRLKQEITVDEARKLKGFFAMSSTDGGRRVVIVDSADEMNPSAANAVLKLLEEPPARTVLLLVSHQPSRLLPTIRSRCRTLRCDPLTPADMEHALAAAGATLPEDMSPLTALAVGSVGVAYRLISEDGLALYANLVALFQSAPGIDRDRALSFCNAVGQRGGEVTIDQALETIDLFLSRLARTGVLGPPDPEAARGEAALMSRLCPHLGAARHWAALQQTVSERTRHGVAVNLDPAALLLDTVLKINAGAEEGLPAPV
ncbi:DNA polymerase III subunit delta' [Tropicimonas isoalkanivorans]|uniref:DNA polymerase III, delta prime subunit n=1 Tax=Tropicimonas isoalkanivorans TaxID=441112 RepID=A0A1I1FX88_9RHOB|nr:DNA polymerase III subunit delta' [Tropicimonas isoalkanivorans]SFC01663.1 DNA polymerase III, delta prime subunit [Tropicimonas isoalkanivorans]